MPGDTGRRRLPSGRTDFCACSFLLPGLAPGAIRDLRDPDAPHDDEDEA